MKFSRTKIPADSPRISTPTTSVLFEGQMAFASMCEPRRASEAVPALRAPCMSVVVRGQKRTDEILTHQNTRGLSADLDADHLGAVRGTDGVRFDVRATTRQRGSPGAEGALHERRCPRSEADG